MTPVRRVFVTGAAGFVGRRLCSELACHGHTVRAGVRDMRRAAGLAGEVVATGTFSPTTDWRKLLEGVDAIVHLAARVHVMRETAADPIAEFRAVNVQATEAFARAAAACGVRRFVYVSSVKVNGEATGDRPFAAEDMPAPTDPYGVSKWEAERALERIAATGGLEVSVVRPPLVYGPGVGGNFLRLLRLVHRGIPLPFGAIENRRSMIYNGNLASALVACVSHPNAGGKTYLVSDGEDFSTRELVRNLAAALGKPARLWPVPAGILRLGGALIGAGTEVERLIGSLTVDSMPIRKDLAWSPPYVVASALDETVRSFGRVTA